MKKVVINKDKCLGCGMCVGIESDVFDFDDDGLAKVNNDNINDDNKENVNNAIDSCPVAAIEVVDDNNKENVNNTAKVVDDNNKENVNNTAKVVDEESDE